MSISQSVYSNSTTRNIDIEYALNNIISLGRDFANQISSSIKQSIIINTNEYNNEERFICNYKEYQPYYIMINNSVQTLTKDKAKAMCKLNEIGKLEDNWNENGASKFSASLVLLCKNILSELPVIPQIFPTASSSIQFEYNNIKGEYLEIEVSDSCIEIYTELLESEIEDTVYYSDNYIQKIRQVVVNFYE